MAYLTPDFPDGSDMIVRTIVVNSQPIDIQALIDGAISELFEAKSFLQKGTMTEEETAQYFRDMVNETMEFCALVLECFNDPDFVGDIVDAMSANGFPLNGNTGENGSATGSLVMGDILQDLEVECVAGSDLFGVCMQVVATMDRYFVDFLQLAEVYSNQYELAGKISEFIPVLSNFVSASLDLADWLAETFAENYLGAYTVAVQELIACEIYNLVLQSCELTLDVILQAYENVIGSGVDIPSNNIVDMIEYVVALPVTIPAQLVARSHAMALQIMNFAQDFFGLTPKNMRFFVGAYAGYPVPEDCEEGWCYKFDFAIDNGGFTENAPPNSGLWVDGVGWTSEYYNGTLKYLVSIRKQEGFTYNLQRITVKCVSDYSHGEMWLGNGSDTWIDYNQIAYENVDGFQYMTWEFDYTVDRFVINDARNNNSTARIIEVVCEGVGDNPFGSGNCT